MAQSQKKKGEAIYVTVFTDRKSIIRVGDCVWPGRDQQACDKRPLQKISKRNRKHGTDKESEFAAVSAADRKYAHAEPWNPKYKCVHRKAAV